MPGEELFSGKSSTFGNLRFLLRSWSGALTVDCDVYGLGVSVDVVDSRALVRPRFLPGDCWDLQVLVIRCDVSYHRSHTRAHTHKVGENGDSRSALIPQVSSCDPHCCCLTCPWTESVAKWCKQGEEEGEGSDARLPASLFIWKGMRTA